MSPVVQKLRRKAALLWTESPQGIWSKVVHRFHPAETRDSEAHVWCLSTGRVGTATLTALGELSTDVLSEHEPTPLLFGLGKHAYEATSDGQDDPILREAVLTCRRNVPQNGQRVYLETSPEVTFVARQLGHAFPSSRFIHVVRHPVAVIRSGMRRGWYDGHANDNWRITPTADEMSIRDWQALTAFEKNVWSWAATNRWILEFTQSIPVEKSLLLKSEDLYSGSGQVATRFFDFLGVQQPPKKRIQRVLGQKINAQQQGDFPKFDEWSESQKETLKRVAGEVMDQLGYQV